MFKFFKKGINSLNKKESDLLCKLAEQMPEEEFREFLATLQ